MPTTSPERVESTDIAIWGRLMNASNSGIGQQAARELLEIGFTPGDKVRMIELAARSNDGTLTPEERGELENYVRIGHFLALMHLRARRRLNSGGVNDGGT